MKKNIFFITTIILLTIELAPANAFEMKIHFEGIVYQADGFTNEYYAPEPYDWSSLDSFFNIGDVVLGNLYFDSNASVTRFEGDSSSSASWYDIIRADVKINSFSVYTNAGRIGVIDGYYAGIDQYVFESNVFNNGLYSLGVNEPLLEFGFGLYDESERIFNDSSLPLDKSIFSDLLSLNTGMIGLTFVNDLSRLNTGYFFLNASITNLELITPVPEPNTMLLLGSAFGGLLLYWRQSKKKSTI